MPQCAYIATYQLIPPSHQLIPPSHQLIPGSRSLCVLPWGLLRCLERGREIGLQAMQETKALISR